LGSYAIAKVGISSKPSFYTPENDLPSIPNVRSKQAIPVVKAGSSAPKKRKFALEEQFPDKSNTDTMQVDSSKLVPSTLGKSSLFTSSSASLIAESSEEATKREERKSRFEKEKKIVMEGMKKKQVSGSVLQSARKQPSVMEGPDSIDWNGAAIIGTCAELEKPYLRLTSAPDASTVRPLPILKKTLELLRSKWKTESNYTYICDQFKSLRQDLTVQRIKNEFTVQVYEIHSRIAIEKVFHFDND
jgi:hypothetical protein